MAAEAEETSTLQIQKSADNIRIVSTSTQTEWSWLEDLTSSKYKTEPIVIANDSSKNQKEKSPTYGVNDNDNSDVKEQASKDIEKVKTDKSKLTEDKKNIDVEPSENIKNLQKQDVVKPAAVLTAADIQGGQYYSSDSDEDSFSTESEDEIELHFPAVGPPQMLQHLRESFDNFPANSDQDFSKSNNKNGTGLHKSFFSGPCQFCGQPVLPLPTVDEIQKLPNKQLYCCYEYEDFIKLYITYNEKKHVKDEVIDIKPHAPYGTKAARKAAKDRAAERMREKEIERQKAATAQANFFSFNRQVKTVQYALSSSKCMEEGWTLRPQTPIKEPIIKEEDDFSIEVNSTLLQNKNELYVRYYDNGNKFLVIYPDGTGCCFYPSGNVAVMIVAKEKGRYTYILQKDSSDYDTDDTGILSIFEPNGNASCYFKDGSLRLLLTPYYGIQMDKMGNYKKKWQWYFIKGHVHTPPFQPICLSLNKELSCRVMEQDNIIVSFTSGQRAVRFNVGAKLKALKMKIPPISKNEDAQFIYSMQKKVQALTEKIKLTMRFPKSPKLEALVSKSHYSPERNSSKAELQLPKLKGKEPSVIVN